MNPITSVSYEYIKTLIEYHKGLHCEHKCVTCDSIRQNFNDTFESMVLQVIHSHGTLFHDKEVKRNFNQNTNNAKYSYFEIIPDENCNKYTISSRDGASKDDFYRLIEIALRKTNEKYNHFIEESNRENAKNFLRLYQQVVQPYLCAIGFTKGDLAYKSINDLIELCFSKIDLDTSKQKSTSKVKEECVNTNSGQPYYRSFDEVYNEISNANENKNTSPKKSKTAKKTCQGSKCPISVEKNSAEEELVKAINSLEFLAKTLTGDAKTSENENKNLRELHTQVPEIIEKIKNVTKTAIGKTKEFKKLKDLIDDFQRFYKENFSEFKSLEYCDIAKFFKKLSKILETYNEWGVFTIEENNDPSKPTTYNSPKIVSAKVELCDKYVKGAFSTPQEAVEAKKRLEKFEELAEDPKKLKIMLDELKQSLKDAEANFSFVQIVNSGLTVEINEVTKEKKELNEKISTLNGRVNELESQEKQKAIDKKVENLKKHLEIFPFSDDANMLQIATFMIDLCQNHEAISTLNEGEYELLVFACELADEWHNDSDADYKKAFIGVFNLLIKIEKGFYVLGEERLFMKRNTPECISDYPLLKKLDKISKCLLPFCWVNKRIDSALNKIADDERERQRLSEILEKKYNAIEGTNEFVTSLTTHRTGNIADKFLGLIRKVTLRDWLGQTQRESLTMLMFLIMNQSDKEGLIKFEKWFSENKFKLEDFNRFKEESACEQTLKEYYKEFENETKRNSGEKADHSKDKLEWSEVLRKLSDLFDEYDCFGIEKYESTINESMISPFYSVTCKTEFGFVSNEGIPELIEKGVARKGSVTALIKAEVKVVKRKLHETSIGYNAIVSFLKKDIPSQTDGVEATISFLTALSFAFTGNVDFNATDKLQWAENNETALRLVLIDIEKFLLLFQSIIDVSDTTKSEKLTEFKSYLNEKQEEFKAILLQSGIQPVDIIPKFVDGKLNKIFLELPPSKQVGTKLPKDGGWIIKKYQGSEDGKEGTVAEVVSYGIIVDNKILIKPIVMAF